MITYIPILLVVLSVGIADAHRDRGHRTGVAVIPAAYWVGVKAPGKNYQQNESMSFLIRRTPTARVRLPHLASMLTVGEAACSDSSFVRALAKQFVFLPGPTWFHLRGHGWERRLRRLRLAFDRLHYSDLA